MADFIPGLQLSRLFYIEAVKPILDADFPDLRYAAARIGDGSEVLGFDTEMSADHDWGARLMIFLGEDDFNLCCDAIHETLRLKLPYKFRGFSTNFGLPDPDDNGTRLLEDINDGAVNHRVEIFTIRGFFLDYFNFDLRLPVEPADWLTFQEQKLYQTDKRYPLIVKVYGGSRLSTNVNRFGLESGADNLQLLAARGYVVLVPDSPLRIGQPLTDLKVTVLPGVDAVIEIGIADPERLGIFGHSYGGYSTLALLVQTNRFKAAAMSGSMSNLLSNYGEMRGDGSAASIGWAETGQGRMGGSPWEVQDRYITNSPFFFLDRVNTPLLIQHGAADRIVSVARAEETFTVLRRLGKSVVFVRYEGEGHAPNSWKSANIEDYWRRMFQWFERYLKDTRSSPTP